MGFELAMAFLAGAISFISPCIIPMIMVYLTTITGFSFETLLKHRKAKDVRRTVVAKTLVFVLSFTLVFTIIGALSGVLVGSMGKFFEAMSLAAGVLFVLLGLHHLGVLKKIFWRFGTMRSEEKLQALSARWKGKYGALSYAGVFVVGLGFALVCSHCISPTLFPTILLASSTQNFASGGLVMLAFSLGLGASFFIAALFLSQTIEKLKWIAKHRRAVNLLIGLFFLAFGILLLSGEYLSFVSLLYRLIPWRVGVM